MKATPKRSWDEYRSGANKRLSSMHMCNICTYTAPTHSEHKHMHKDMHMHIAIIVCRCV